MNRRHFSRTILTALGASALPSGIVMAQSRRTAAEEDLPLIDGPRINGWLAEFSRFGRREDGGVDRVAFLPFAGFSSGTGSEMTVNSVAPPSRLVSKVVPGSAILWRTYPSASNPPRAGE